MQYYDALNPAKGFNAAAVQADGTNGFPCETIQIRQWVAYRRLSDGYWNASALCDQFGKRLDNWMRLPAHKQFSDLIDAGSHGSWMHPDLVMLIASWLDNHFYFGYMAMLRDEANGRGLDLDSFLADTL